MNADFTKNFFATKLFFCNCDDPFESMFFAYFAMHFNDFGLKKLISSSYVSSPIMENLFGMKNFDTKKDAITLEMTEFKDWNGDGREDLYDVQYF